MVNSLKDMLKWCSVSLSDVIVRGKRLEAIVFDTSEIVPIVPERVNSNVFSFNLSSAISHFVNLEINFSALG